MYEIDIPRLRKAVKDSGYRQKYIADMCGINDRSFSRILKGTHGSPAYPNERIADYKGKLKPGDVLVHDSSIGIYDPIGGTPAILTAREGQPINGKKQYTDLLVSSGYEWKRDVLAVVRAKV